MMVPSIDPHRLQDILAGHLTMYQRKTPFYQATMLDSLASVWTGNHQRLLDVGGGTGVVAQAISELFPVNEVVAVDVVDRFCPTLTVETHQYDGEVLPFADDAFDAATLNNVMHHVPLASRGSLLREIRRVVAGPIYIKDHETSGRLDDLRLTALDAIGNIPFGGMLWARYLHRSEWEHLARDNGYRIAGRAPSAAYRRGPYAFVFPNRLEVTMRLERV